MPNIVNLVTVTYRHTDAMNESSEKEMPDPIISTPDTNLLVDNELNNELDDERDSRLEYPKEMLQTGLEPADVQSFMNEFKLLENVKSKRIHCTSCDKHIGSAPNDLQNRYEHPLLKVLICGECFQFYSSGDFEKDEDGSELYCRWCGEGGQVFCCTKCPFVFCKKCIRRNLGRATAKIIEDSDNWNCFSCDKTQICHLRATYWAVQKYAEEMIKQSKIIGDVDMLSVDNYACCNAIKRKSSLGNKSGQPPNKKQKIIPFLPISKKSNRTENWKPPLISQEPEDEVICTPDIMPLVNSPSTSPIREDSPTQAQLFPPPPPMIPLTNQQISYPVITTIPSVRIRPPVSGPVQVPALQKQLSNNLSRIILTPPNQIRPGSTVVLRKTLPNKTTPNNGNHTVILPRGSLYKVSNSGTNIQKQIPTTSRANNNGQDWFSQAVNDCTAVAKYITINIETLSDVHSRARASEKVMRELHNAIQTYMHIAIEKIKRMKSVIRTNFEKDYSDRLKKTKVNIIEDNSSSDDNNSKDSKAKQNKTTGYVLTKNIKPDEVLFDMDVTNASDEENQSGRNSAVATPTNMDSKIGNESDDDIQVVNNEKSNEVIQIMDSDDETEDSQNISDSDKDNNGESLMDTEVTSSRIEPISETENDSDKRTSVSELKNENSVCNVSNKCSSDEGKEMCDIEDVLGSNIVLRKNESLEMCDIEDILSSNVVLRKNTPAANFDDAFNKFVSQKPEEKSPDIPENISESLKETINIVQELDIPEYENDICTNKDNGSLSIPPETGITANEMDLLMAKDTSDTTKENTVKGPNDAAVNNEILTLQQMAENCVTSVDVHQNSTKCKG